MKLLKGFTIIEMLVIIGIMLLLSGVLIIYSRSGETASIIIRQAAKIVADTNRAKNLAITTTTFKTEMGELIHPCGYGVYFDSATEPNQYTIFADLSSSCELSDHLRPTDGSADLITESLTASLSITSKNIDQVFFLSPDPTIIFNGINEEEIRTGEIAIGVGNTKVSVKISKTGQVSTF